MDTPEAAGEGACSPNASDAWNQCPTRADGQPVRIAHLIDPATCQQRQREHYHKCFVCAHQNGRAEQARRLANAARSTGAILARPNPAQVG